METKKVMRVILCTLAVILLFAATVAFGVWRVNPPTADEGSPAFQRMMSHIERLATGVRWVGTEEVAATRDEIIAEIEAMGLVPIVHRTAFTLRDFHAVNEELRLLQNADFWTPLLVPFSYEWEEAVLANIAEIFPNHPLVHQGHMYVYNILVTLSSPHTESGGMMFVAHFDTQPNTPGAADAMLPVAAMLEVLRAHADHPNLANDLHFLFTDGEEFSALGAWAFSRDFQPLTGEIDILLNLEAVGNSGGVVNFQTTDAPFDMMRLFSRAVPRPIGFHWGDWVYRTTMPGSYTDFNFFRAYGFQGLNFAILGGNAYYHTPYDTYENLNRNTAWHYLIMTMALAEYAAEHSLLHLRESSADAIFFPFLPNRMVVMTTTVSNVLTGLAFVLALAFLVYSFQTKMPKAWLIRVLLILLMIATALVLILVHVLAYLFWIPLFAVAVSAFLKRWKIFYRCALVGSGVVSLILWTPPVYLLLLLFQII